MHKQYVIQNWSEYNKALVNRGRITLWVDDASIKNWFSFEHSGKAGHPKIYSDQAISLTTCPAGNLQLASQGFAGVREVSLRSNACRVTCSEALSGSATGGNY